MPILPLDDPEPFVATLGVMLYPGQDEKDCQNARAFASQSLAAPLRQFHQEGYLLTYEALARIAEGAGGCLDDLENRRNEAIATGELFKTYFVIFNTDPVLASWENAVRLVHTAAVGANVSASRSALYAARRRFHGVAHLWAAWCIRERRFREQPEVGYTFWHDFQYFLAESEILRCWGQTWHPPRAKALPPLPDEVWQVPDGWAPPERRPGWPPTGMIPDLVIPEDLRSELRKAGRPRKASQ